MALGRQQMKSCLIDKDFLVEDKIAPRFYPVIFLVSSVAVTAEENVPPCPSGYMDGSALCQVIETSAPWRVTQAHGSRG